MVTGIRELAVGVESMEYDLPLSKAISAIARSASHGVAVVRGRELAGVVDDRSLRDFSDDAAITKLGTVAVRTPVASYSTTPEELVRMFLETHSRIIPIVEGSRVVGAVSRPAVMRLIENAPRVRGRKAAEFASRNAVIGDGASIYECRDKMRELGTYHLAVVGADGGLSGVVSSYDICTKVLPNLREKPRSNRQASRNPVLSQEVSAIFKDVPARISHDAPLADAARMMYRDNVSALVLVDGAGKPAGMLSVRDALHAVLKPAVAPVFVYGLREDEKVMAQSIRDTATVVFERIGNKTPTDYMAVHVKSVLEGAKRRYQVKAKASLAGRMHMAQTPEMVNRKNAWDLQLSVKEALDELYRSITDKGTEKARARKKRAGGGD